MVLETDASRALEPIPEIISPSGASVFFIFPILYTVDILRGIAYTVLRRYCFHGVTYGPPHIVKSMGSIS